VIVSRRLLAIVAAIVVVLAGAAIALVFSLGRSESPATFTVQGALSCPGRIVCSGYADIAAGTQVEVLNQANEVLAVGMLRLANDGRHIGNGLDVADYTFTIPGVPRGQHLYGVHVGNANRGVIWEPEDQAVNSGFVLTLGS
jgi:hypothetical protein